MKINDKSNFIGYRWQSFYVSVVGQHGKPLWGVLCKQLQNTSILFITFRESFHTTKISYCFLGVKACVYLVLRCYETVSGNKNKKLKSNNQHAFFELLFIQENTLCNAASKEEIFTSSHEWTCKTCLCKKSQQLCKY